jgi:hypothetical protein
MLKRSFLSKSENMHKSGADTLPQASTPDRTRIVEGAVKFHCYSRGLVAEYFVLVLGVELWHRQDIVWGRYKRKPWCQIVRVEEEKKWSDFDYVVSWDETNDSVVPSTEAMLDVVATIREVNAERDGQNLWRVRLEARDGSWQ